jgi:hypothetical protein
MRSFPKIMAWASLVVWLTSIYLFLHYDATRPTKPQPARGRIYSSNNHGHVTYLTEREENYLTGLAIGAFGLFFIGAIADYFQRNPRKIGELHSAAMDTRRALVRPASWWVFARTALRRLASVRISSVIGTLVGRRSISLHSNESVSDCRTRLARSIGFNTVGPINGSISGDKLHLYVAKQEFWNSMAPHFHGRLIAAPSGTVVDGRFRMHFFVRIFLIIWFTGVTFIGGKMASFYIHSRSLEPPSLGTYPTLLFPGALLLCGLLFVYWCKKIGEDDEPQIVTFLQNVLKAEPRVACISPAPMRA